MKTPFEIVEYTIEASDKKIKRKIFDIIILGFIAGASIAFGASGNIMIGASLSKLDVGFAKFLGASIFPVGLMFVVIYGADLFTSSTMISILHTEKKSTVYKIIKNLSLVYIGNLIGALVIAFITTYTSSYSTTMLDYVHDIALHKVNTDAISLILKGFLCNIMVCGAVILSYSAKDVISKIFAIWFPITLFVILGYDHCVANMFYIPMSMMNNSGITIIQFLYNLLFATIGNFLGGYFIIHSLYLAHYKNK